MSTTQAVSSGLRGHSLHSRSHRVPDTWRPHRPDLDSHDHHLEQSPTRPLVVNNCAEELTSFSSPKKTTQRPSLVMTYGSPRQVRWSFTTTQFLLLPHVDPPSGPVVVVQRSWVHPGLSSPSEHKAGRPPPHSDPRPSRSLH